MTTTWQILIDWNRDGSFATSNDDVTSDVKSADWFLGAKRPYQDTVDSSTLTLVLNNSDRRYSPENASSPLAENVVPFRPVKITSDDGTTERTHWIGWIEKIEPSVNQFGERTVRITASGPMQFFKAAETQIELQENQRTDEIIAKLIEEVVIPPALVGAWFIGLEGSSELDLSTYLANTSAYSDLDAGEVMLALAADNWVSRNGGSRETFNVYRAIADVTAAERGRFLFDREGKAIFWNRTRLQDEVASSVTLDDAMNDLRYIYAGIDSDFKNEVIVTCHPRVVDASDQSVLWQLDQEVTIPAGKTRNISVRYQDGDIGNARIGAKDVTLEDVVFSVGSATITLETRANSASLEITNSGSVDAKLSSAKVRGRKITDYGKMEATAAEGLSMAKYGRRSLKMNLPSVDNVEYAQAIADFEVARRSEPRGRVEEVMLTSHGLAGGNNHDHQIARTLGDVVTISETQTGHSGKPYYIIGEAHRLSMGATLYETTWYLEPAPESPFPWKLGVEGRSDLDTETILAF